MRGRWLFIGIPVWIIVSAAIAYALVFFTPWFAVYHDYGSYSSRGRFVTDSVTPYYDYGGYGFSPDAEELAKRQPEDLQKMIKELWSDLGKMSDPDLYILKSMSDACLGEVNCRNLESKDVKPFIEAALASRQTAETAAIARRSLYVAAGSLFVSFLSMGFAALTFATRKHPSRRGQAAAPQDEVVP